MAGFDSASNGLNSRQPDLANGDDPGVIEPGTQCVDMFGRMLFQIHRVQAVRWIQLVMTCAERLDPWPAVGVDRWNDHGVHTSVTRTLDHRVAITIKGNVVQVDMTVGEPKHPFVPMAAQGPMRLLCEVSVTNAS